MPDLMPPNKDTLVILTPGFPADENDSACIPPQQVFVRRLATQYPELSIRIFSFQYPFVARDYLWHGIPVTSFGGRNKRKFFRLMLWARILKNASKFIKNNPVIGILSFWHTDCSFIAKKLAHKFQVPYYAWILGQDAKKDNLYVRRINAAPSELIALSDFIRDEFQKNHGIQPAHLIPPGIDSDMFDAHPVAKDLDIFAAGSLIPLKQYSLLIDIVAALKKNYPGIKVVLAGKGPDRQLIEKKIADLGLTQNMELAGEVPHVDVLRLMQRTKLFLHPSSYEGFGVVCLEALYAGAKVISFCQPMKRSITNWHIASTQEEMTQIADRLLRTNPLYDSICPFPIKNTVVQMMQLFAKR
jgi:glycosyltransferase involved in cell wall biosynthesis